MTGEPERHLEVADAKRIADRERDARRPGDVLEPSRTDPWGPYGCAVRCGTCGGERDSGWTTDRIFFVKRRDPKPCVCGDTRFVVVEDL